jgi:hypothetical protein
MKQTAVEWLWDTLGDKGYFKKLPVSEFKEAKAMEKEQITDGYVTGQYDLADKKFGPQEYYNETYGGQESNTNTGAVGYKALEHKEPVVVGTLRGPNGNTAIFKGDAVIGTEEINPFKKGNK